MEAFAAPALYAPALLPPDFAQAELAARPTRTAGGQPSAAVLLVEIEVQGLVD